MDYPDMRYTVYVGTAQVEGRALTKHEAESVADYYEGQGYDDVQVYDLILQEIV
jgi:DNA-binding protein Fis